MTKSFRKTLSVLLAALMLVMTMGVTCFADTANAKTPSVANSVDVPVELTQGATSFDFEVTEKLNASADANSNEMTIDSLTVTNLSLAGQIDYDLDIVAESPYTLDAYSDSDTFANMAVDSCVIAIQADDSVDMSTGTYEDAGTALAANGGNNTNTFTGLISTSSSAVTATKIATATPTVEWVKAE